MDIDFDLDNVRVIEFGVYIRGDGLYLVPVDDSVQQALKEMIRETFDLLSQFEDPEDYDPANYYAGEEYVYLTLDSELATFVRHMHNAQQLQSTVHALDNPSEILCYFARATDNQGRYLTALRRAVHFKGVVKTRLIRIVNNALRLVSDRYFKLDSNFDLLINSNKIHILRPAAFDLLARTEEVLQQSIRRNIHAIKQDLPFVDWEGVERFVRQHRRAARYLAAIRSSQSTRDINKEALLNLCRRNRVFLSERDGKIVVDTGHELDFLEILDRRRYEIELSLGKVEYFRAKSRRKLNE